MTRAASTVCGACGRAPRADEPLTRGGTPWTWSSTSSDERPSWLCPDCAREHARGIEAKLDREWW